MAFLAINGYTIPCLDGSVHESTAEHGPTGPSFKGWTRDAIRARARTWSASVPMGIQSNNDAIRHLVLGQGHHFAFDTTLYSDGYVGPSAGYSIALGTSSPTPKFGTRRANPGSNSTLSYVVDVPLGDNWTLMFYYNSANTTPGANTYDHYAIVRTNGVSVVYKNGVVSTSISNYTVTVSGTSATFSLLGKDTAGSNSANIFYDDLVILPWPASANMVAAWSALTVAFSSMPYLNLTGTILQETGPAIVRGSVGDRSFAMGSVNGSWYGNLSVLPVTFVEAQPMR